MSGTKPPSLTVTDSQQIKQLRKQLGLNQHDFWSRIRVTQSGGSRYETGRAIPEPVLMLMNMAYGPRAKAEALLKHLRDDGK